MKKDVPLCINFLTKKTPWKGLGADSEEKHEPASDVATSAADSLKALDPERPIREADIRPRDQDVCFGPNPDSRIAAKRIITQSPHRHVLADLAAKQFRV